MNSKRDNASNYNNFDYCGKGFFIVNTFFLTITFSNNSNFKYIYFTIGFIFDFEKPFAANDSIDTTLSLSCCELVLIAFRIMREWQGSTTLWPDHCIVSLNPDKHSSVMLCLCVPLCLWYHGSVFLFLQSSTDSAIGFHRGKRIKSYNLDLRLFLVLLQLVADDFGTCILSLDPHMLFRPVANVFGISFIG